MKENLKNLTQKLVQEEEQGGPSHTEGKKEGGGEDPPKTPPSWPYYLDGSLPSPFEKKKKFDENFDFNCLN